MNEQSLRIALRIRAAWEPLTDRQSEIVLAFIEQKTISATARHLGVNRETVRRALHYAGKKFAAFGDALG